jgi:thiol-disulfide isomerase/thioredoxin
MKPVVDGLKAEYAGRIEFRRLDTTSGNAETDRLANLFQVQYVPTFVFVNADGTTSDLIVGGTTADVLRAKLNALK